MDKTVMFRGQRLRVEINQYRSNDRFAIQLFTMDHEPYLVATSNLVDIPIDDENTVFIKDYSENQGILQCLVENRIVEDTGRTVLSTHVSFPICKLLIKQNEKQTDAKENGEGA